jgi:hypothetical protein
MFHLKSMPSNKAIFCSVMSVFFPCLKALYMVRCVLTHRPSGGSSWGIYTNTGIQHESRQRLLQTMQLSTYFVFCRNIAIAMNGMIGPQLHKVFIPQNRALVVGPDKVQGIQHLLLGRTQGRAVHAHLVDPVGQFFLSRTFLWHPAVAMLLSVFSQFAQSFIPRHQGHAFSFRSGINRHERTLSARLVLTQETYFSSNNSCGSGSQRNESRSCDAGSGGSAAPVATLGGAGS